MTDLVTSWLRTVVPGLYSAAITAVLAWAAVEVPWLAGALDALHIDPLAPTTVAAVVALVLAAWYAVWRKLEPKLPDVLTRILLGSAKAPLYIGSFPEAKYATDDRVLLFDGALVTIGATIMEPGAKVPSYTVGYPSGKQAEVRETDIIGKR